MNSALKALSAGFLLALAPATSMAQSQPPGMPVMAPKRLPAIPQPNAIPLYQGAAPGWENASQTEVWTGAMGETWIRNVTRPTLTPFLPKRGKATGAAVLVVPGGGFQFVSISNEGWPIAQWLANRGIAAFVLKYRTLPTPDSEAEFFGGFARMVGNPRLASERPPEMVAAAQVASADAQVALRMIRGNAQRWGVDPARVGMLGFSAGAMATMATAHVEAPEARPDFIAPIYGFMASAPAPARPQPMFAAIAADDPLISSDNIGLLSNWRKAGGSVEFHLYSGGGHGFGSHTKGTTSDLWFEQFVAWMRAQKLLERQKK
jgi:acetyl esterase/lipase